MDNILFERLLFEEESSTLDFKKVQYRFTRESDDEKSELLKDVLGFANAWRRSEACILIGVEEIRGGRSKVVGIAETDHLDDHSLQQFVNNLTNRPVRFHYEAFGFEGKQIGVIRIDQQARPIYLKRPYGKLDKDKVYIRRGTSTDPTKPASLEEVSLMGQTVGPQSAELVVEFAYADRDDSLGSEISWDAEFCQMPPIDQIPDLTAPKQQHPFLGLAALEDPMNRINADYYRELADYEFVRRLFRPVRVLVKNVGQVVASNVQCELQVLVGVGVDVRYDLPHAPKQRSSLALAGIKPALRRVAGEVTINKNDDRYRIEIDCGDLQPGRPVWSEIFYVGKGDTGEVKLSGTIYAANLPQPKDCALAISANISRRTVTVPEVVRLPGPADPDD